MFDISSLQYNSDNPALTAIVFTIIFSVVLGTLIAFTYEKTSKVLDRPNHFLQAMVLITIVAATIMQAIGDSVARGLGMLGALSIIRFRTTVSNPRNIVFIFASIASGIACGVFGFLIALVGTLGFCLTAFILSLTSFNAEKSMIGSLKIQVPKAYEAFPELEKTLDKYCQKYILESYKVFQGEKKAHLLLYEYRLKLKATYSGGHLVDSLKDFQEVKVLGLSFRNNSKEII